MRVAPDGAWKSAMDVRRAFILATAALLVAPLARSGHELPVYPSYYPHEIEIATLISQQAAERLPAGKLHAYVGGTPPLASAPSDKIASVESLGAFVVVRLNPASAVAKDDSLGLRGHCGHDTRHGGERRCGHRPSLSRYAVPRRLSPPRRSRRGRQADPAAQRCAPTASRPHAASLERPDAEPRPPRPAGRRPRLGCRHRGGRAQRASSPTPP